MAGERSVKAPVSAEVSTLHLVPCAKHFSSNCWTPSRSFLPVTLLSSSLLYLSSALSPSQQIYIICCPSSTLSPNSSFFPHLFFSVLLPPVTLCRYRFFQMFSRGTFSAFVLSLALVALADPTPSAPSPGQVFNAGSTCQIAWTPDSSGLWKVMNIQLMTGDNLQMVALTSPSCCFFFQVITID